MKIVLIDDDGLMRADSALVLKAAHASRGDEVLPARNAAEALEFLNRGNIDGVISDLIGVGGPLGVIQIRQRFPAVPVVVWTGDKDAPEFSDPMVRVLFKGAGPGDAGPLEARAALAEMIGGRA